MLINTSRQSQVSFNHFSDQPLDINTLNSTSFDDVYSIIWLGLEFELTLFTDLVTAAVVMVEIVDSSWEWKTGHSSHVVFVTEICWWPPFTAAVIDCSWSTTSWWSFFNEGRMSCVWWAFNSWCACKLFFRLWSCSWHWSRSVSAKGACCCPVWLSWPFNLTRLCHEINPITMA